MVVNGRHFVRGDEFLDKRLDFRLGQRLAVKYDWIRRHLYRCGRKLSGLCNRDSARLAYSFVHRHFRHPDRSIRHRHLSALELCQHDEFLHYKYRLRHACFFRLGVGHPFYNDRLRRIVLGQRSHGIPERPDAHRHIATCSNMFNFSQSGNCQSAELINIVMELDKCYEFLHYKCRLRYAEPSWLSIGHSTRDDCL